MSRNHKEDSARIKEIRQEFLPELSRASKEFMNSIAGRTIPLSKLQGEWFDSIWEQYLKF